MKTARALPLIALGVLLMTGCSSETPAEWNSREEVTTATTELSTTLNQTGSNTLGQTCEGLVKSQAGLSDLPDAPDASAEALSAVNASLATAITSCQSAADSGDPEALLAATQSIVAVKEAMAALTGNESAPEAVAAS